MTDIIDIPCYCTDTFFPCRYCFYGQSGEEPLGDPDLPGMTLAQQRHHLEQCAVHARTPAETFAYMERLKKIS